MTAHPRRYHRGSLCRWRHIRGGGAYPRDIHNAAAVEVLDVEGSMECGVPRSLSSPMSILSRDMPASARVYMPAASMLDPGTPVSTRHNSQYTLSAVPRSVMVRVAFNSRASPRRTQQPAALHRIAGEVSAGFAVQVMVTEPFSLAMMPETATLPLPRSRS